MPRLKFTLAYDGTAFHGWQIQEGKACRTVQGCLEDALERLCGQAVRVHGAGRTDAGVHAEGQVAHADIPPERAARPWLSALNALLPDDVSVLRVEEAADDFHSRFMAREKIYAYHLWLSRTAIFPTRRAYVWMTGRLDLTAMSLASCQLTGCRDFASFQNAGTEVASTVRTISEISWRYVEGQGFGGQALEVVWLFRADGFLKQMVRNLIGCLVEVGRNKLQPTDIPAILAARDRSVAPATAPARGLVLKEILY